MDATCRELEAEVAGILARRRRVRSPQTIDPDLYLDLAEHVVRLAAAWQQPDGMIGDPHNPKGVESVTATARYTAAVGHLLSAGRCGDLLEAAMDAMDWCCSSLWDSCCAGEPWPCSVFNVKDMVILYEALRPYSPGARFDAWTNTLSALPPEDLYHGEANFVFYGTAAEVLRIRSGLSNRWDYIDTMLAGQMSDWSTHGMYRDPGDPVTYDLTVRQCLALMLEYGYAGGYAEWARLTLRTGALSSLLCASPTGVVPAGGRSAQYHMQEAMLAYLAEWQAKEEVRSGHLLEARALRRLALLGAVAVKRWLLQAPYLCAKNQMRDDPFHGQDGFGMGDQNAHSGYGLLAANLFAGAYHIGDHAIPPDVSPADVGGYVLHLDDAFWRLWATVRGYHIQIDTMAQAGYDATGLCRFHRRGVHIETGLNMGIPAAPQYRLSLPAPPRNVALGVGWPTDGGGWQYLSSAGRDTHDVELDVEEEGEGRVAFTLSYLSHGRGLGGVDEVRESYSLSADGLQCSTTVPGANRVRLQVPIIETDGELVSDITLGERGVALRYSDHVYRVRVLGAEVRAFMEPWLAANRNGLYRVAVFEVDGDSITYEAELPLP